MSSSYIGAEPVDTYSSLAVQHFTTSVTTSYSLSQSVTSENDIRLTINNVVQQPGSSYAYTCSGSTLTLSSATASSDTMYCVFIGKSIGTINPPDGSVSDAKITAMASSKLTGSVAVANGGTGVGTHTANNVLVGNGTSAIASVAPSTSGNVLTSTGSAWASSVLPAGGFPVGASAQIITSNQAIAHNTFTKLQFNGELHDPNGNYDHSSGYDYTVPSGQAGCYFVSAQFSVANMQDGRTLIIGLKKNSAYMFYAYNMTSHNQKNSVCVSGTLVLAVADVITVDGYHDYGSSRDASHSYNQNHLSIQRVA